MDIGFCQTIFLCVKKHKIWSHYISSIFSLACWHGLHWLIFNIEPALHIWNKAHLGIFLCFYILLDLLIFGWKFFHLSSWERMVCSFHFFFYLSCLGIRPYKIGWEVFPLFFFSGRNYKISVNSLNSLVKPSGPGDLFFQKLFNCEFNFFNGYRTIRVIYFILVEFYSLWFSRNWPISSKLSSLWV